MTYIIFSLVIILIAYFAFSYNQLVRKSYLLKEAWSGMDVQLKRRADLIPNLVEIVKGYAAHEKETLEDVVQARSFAGLNHIQDRETAEKGISGSLRKIISLAEAYPALRADKNFRELQEVLIEIEDDLQYSRRYYNGTVRNLNILVSSFPSNIVANLTGFKPADFFEIDYATERRTPEIDF